MKGFLNSRRMSCALSAVCFVILGICLVVWPDLSRIWLCRLLGGVLLVSGGMYAVLHFSRAKGAAAVFHYDLVLGMVLALVGVWLLTTPDLIIAFIQYILGAILVVHSVLDLQGALNLRVVGAQQWKIAGIIAAITLTLGIVVIWNPFASINALLMLVGIALIYDGLSDLLIIFHLSRTFNIVKTAVEEAVEEAEGEAMEEAVEGAVKEAVKEVSEQENVIESTGEIKR